MAENKLNGGLILLPPKIIVGTTYSITLTDSIINANTSSNAITLTLPTAALAKGRHYIINDVARNVNENKITVVVSGGGTINGKTSLIIGTYFATGNGAAIEIYSNGTEYIITNIYKGDINSIIPTTPDSLYSFKEDFGRAGKMLDVVSGTGATVTYNAHPVSDAPWGQVGEYRTGISTTGLAMSRYGENGTGGISPNMGITIIQTRVKFSSVDNIGGPYLTEMGLSNENNMTVNPGPQGAFAFLLSSGVTSNIRALWSTGSDTSIVLTPANITDYFTCRAVHDPSVGSNNTQWFVNDVLYLTNTITFNTDKDVVNNSMFPIVGVKKVSGTTDKFSLFDYHSVNIIPTGNKRGIS